MNYHTADAVFSPCGTYRYRLWRYWGAARTPLVICMLNPSTAGAADDPTIRKVVGFAQRIGYDGIEVVNLYAFRATDPQVLHQSREMHGDAAAVGPLNDASIRLMMEMHPSNIFFGWGANGEQCKSRIKEVWALADESYVCPQALAVTKHGHPSHPLMLPYSCAPLTLDRPR